MQARGYRSQVVIDFESVFGTSPETPNGIQVPINSCGIRAEQATIEDNTIRNNRNQSKPARGNINVSGGMVVPLDVTAIGHWLKSGFGAPTTTGTGPYVHTYKVTNSQPSLVIEKGFTDITQYELFNGCRLNSLALSFTSGDNDLTANLDFLGASRAFSETAYDSTPTAVALNKFSNFQAAVQEGGSDIAKLTEVSLNVAFGLDGNQYCLGGGGKRGDIPEGMVVVTGNIKGLFEDLALYNKAINDTESSLKVTLTNGTNILVIDIPELQYEQNSPEISGPAGVMVDLNYRAYYENHADASAIKFTLTNSQATY
jgi:hypothetical protein